MGSHDSGNQAERVRLAHQRAHWGKDGDTQLFNFKLQINFKYVNTNYVGNLIF